MKWYHQALIALFVLSLAGGLIYSANHYSGLYESQKLKTKSEEKRADDAESLALSRLDTINDMQIRQRDVAALDAKYTKELTDALSENDALRRKLDNGGRVLVKGRCPVPTSTQAARTSSLGNDATVELSPNAGRNVLSIRAGIISDQKALRYLQEYVIDQCLK